MAHFEGPSFELFFEQFTHNTMIVERNDYMAIRKPLLEKFYKREETEEGIREAME